MIESAVENDICILYVIYKEGEQKTHTQQLILNEKKNPIHVSKSKGSIDTSRTRGFEYRRVCMCVCCTLFFFL